jgi:hypothetical protein
VPIDGGDPTTLPPDRFAVPFARGTVPGTRIVLTPDAEGALRCQDGDAAPADEPLYAPFLDRASPPTFVVVPLSSTTFLFGTDSAGHRMRGWRAVDWQLVRGCTVDPAAGGVAIGPDGYWAAAPYANDVVGAWGLRRGADPGVEIVDAAARRRCGCDVGGIIWTRLRQRLDGWRATPPAAPAAPTDADDRRRPHHRARGVDVAARRRRRPTPPPAKSPSECAARTTPRTAPCRSARTRAPLPTVAATVEGVVTVEVSSATQRQAAAPPSPGRTCASTRRQQRRADRAAPPNTCRRQHRDRDRPVAAPSACAWVGAAERPAPIRRRRSRARPRSTRRPAPPASPRRCRPSPGRRTPHAAAARHGVPSPATARQDLDAPPRHSRGPARADVAPREPRRQLVGVDLAVADGQRLDHRHRHRGVVGPRTTAPADRCTAPPARAALVAPRPNRHSPTASPSDRPRNESETLGRSPRWVGHSV